MARNWYGKKRVTREDKYTRGKISFTAADERGEYCKMFLIALLGYVFFHFIVMGWTW